MRYLETVMGVPMSLDLRDPDDDRSRAAARSAFDLLRAADARFSPFRADSELRRYERGLVDAPSPELAEVLSIAAGAQAASAGAFDIRRPGGDLGALGTARGLHGLDVHDARPGERHGHLHGTVRRLGDVAPDGHRRGVGRARTGVRRRGTRVRGRRGTGAVR